MVGKDYQWPEYIRVVKMCKGTKLENQEYLCVKYRQPGFDLKYQQYLDDGIDFDVEWDRIFAVAIVDGTPVWLEEPFTFYSDFYDLEFTYREEDRRLIGTSYNNEGQRIITVSTPIENAVWSDLTIHKPKAEDTLSNPEAEMPENLISKAAYKQVGGTHYKDKAIQPWTYMEANYTKEEFVGFLRGSTHSYLERYKDKGGVEDLQKAMHYIEKLIEVEGNNENTE